MKIRKFLLAAFLACSTLISLAQKSPVSNPALTADSLATGNYKDVLKSFFQLAFDNLTSDKKELRFTSSPFAVMAQWDSSILVNESYVKYKALRNLNFSFALKLDTNYKFNGFSSGVKYALINKRDETVSRQFVALVQNDKTIKQLFTLTNAVFAYISKQDSFAFQQQLIAEANAFFSGSKNLNQLDSGLQAQIKLLAASNPATAGVSALMAADPAFNINKTGQAIYDDFKKNFHTRPLLTIALDDTTYKDKFFFSNVTLSMQYLQGITSAERKNEIELDLKTALQLTDDTLRKGYDLKHSFFSFEPGINIVLKTRATHNSFFEMKVGGGYYRTFSSLYAGEEREVITLNSTVRIRIFGDIWIPIDIKYDPKTGNVFGFLNVRANFKALKKTGKFLSN
jgi:hypothetical protein